MPHQDKITGKTLDPITPPRQAELRAWLVLNGYSMGDLAAFMGVHPSMVTRIVHGDHAPIKRIRQLLRLGVPASLLPEPSGPPGRPPKAAPEGKTGAEEADGSAENKKSPAGK